MYLGFIQGKWWCVSWNLWGFLFFMYWAIVVHLGNCSCIEKYYCILQIMVLPWKVGVSWKFFLFLEKVANFPCKCFVKIWYILKVFLSLKIFSWLGQFLFVLESLFFLENLSLSSEVLMYLEHFYYIWKTLICHKNGNLGQKIGSALGNFRVSLIFTSISWKLLEMFEIFCLSLNLLEGTSQT